MRFLTCGDGGVLVELADLDETLRVFAALRSATTADKPRGSVLDAVTQLIPAARTILIAFDPLLASRAGIIAAVRALDVSADVCRRSRTVEIPVVYDGEDLADIARLLGVSASQIIARHCARAWSVAFVGFAPGFAYLTGGDEIFDVPRRTVPRLSVPAGAVGLAGTFSGVYPRVSSGGWQLLGHTERTMWDEHADPPALLQPGDAVRFTPVRERAVAAPVSCLSDSGESDNCDAKIRFHVSDSPESDKQKAGKRCGPDSAGVATAALEAVRPGLLTTFQDDGRRSADMGVTGSGAADPCSSHLANALVGNPANAPVLEITGGGVRFVAHGDAVVAVAGAPAPITIIGNADRNDGVSAQHNAEGRAHALERTVVIRQEAMLLRDGEAIEIGVPSSGLRDYLAVRGGFDVERSLGSAATDTMSGIGPKPIVSGQFLAVCRPEASPSITACGGGDGTDRRGADRRGAGKGGTDGDGTCGNSVGLPEPWPEHLPKSGEITELHVHLGPRDDWFTTTGISDFLNRIWTVTAQSNRVGLRLQGECSLERRDAAELASEATPPGSIEVPTSGQPVIFLRDQPVTGGYPVIAVLTPRSLNLAGQLPPGAQIRFRCLSDSGESDTWNRILASQLSDSPESDNQESDKQCAQSQEHKEIRQCPDCSES
ncbi:urea amidolyase family protein [Bifidobacterium moukalabense]|uniref:Urea amidolyase n=1 Tax=Bifidobacterium moukalabense DSM 27321 TaxID=1435051 RepID=W4N625_9BIFI|nr:urea amidolyase family protein [Bifidobacterium moukalabense]ETY70543.1 urea amidolyase [Bifidobacterium moukalabense DSM 27321]